MNKIKNAINMLEEIIAQENLDRELTFKFMNYALFRGFVTDKGTEFAKLLPPHFPLSSRRRTGEEA